MPSPSRNDPCPCGSGRKFKHCCEGKKAPGAVPGLNGQFAGPSSNERQRLPALIKIAAQLAAADRWAEATAPLGEIARLTPANPDAHFQLGFALLRCARTRDGAISLRRAVELRPSFESALIHLVDALEAEGVYDEAAARCGRLARVGSELSTRRFYTAKALILEGKADEAEQELRGLLLVAPSHAPARHRLGMLLSDRGQFDEAARCFRENVDVFPNSFQQWTTIHRITEDDRPLVARMRAKAESPEFSAMTRAMIHFGLGKAYDDLCDYGEAMGNYERGNDLRAASARLHRGALSARFDHMIRVFSKETFQQADPAAESLAEDLPILILGMPRSGTTLVEQILSSHPDVAAAGELGFWPRRSNDLLKFGLDGASLAKAAEDYLALLRKIGPGAQRVTDKNPMNFEVIGSIRRAMPRARIIHCRRNPVDTCLSIYFASFASAHDYASDRGDLVFYYRQYERLMAHWRSLLTPDTFLELDYESVIANREFETRRLLAFCGLDWDDACLAPERNDRAVNTASRWQVRQPVYATSVERWRRYEPWLGELRTLLPTASAVGGEADKVA